MSEDNTPPWLNGSFIQELLKLVENTKSHIEPVHISCKEALPAGNNFLSDCFKVSINYKVSGSNTLQKVSLFVKIPFIKGNTAEFVSSQKLYEKEVKVYNKIHPKMYASGFTMISPISYPVTPMENSLVLEDLSLSGYKMLDRIERMDFQHCFSVLEAFAKYHAMSVAVHNKEPDLIESLGTGHISFKLEHEVGRTKINKTLELFAATLAEIGCERYAQMVRDRIDSYWEKTSNILKLGNVLNVLCHGDCWTPNVMFKHENGKVVGTKFVDFQLSVFSSFAFDVMLFWWTSAKEDVRENHTEKLFEVYRTTLNESLAKLQCGKTLSKEDFESEIKRVAPFSIYLIGFFSALTYSDGTEVSIDFFNPDESYLDLRSFKSKYYRSALPKLMEQGEKIGMFG